MIRESVVGDVPRIDNTAFVDPAAVIIGRVSRGPNCSIGPGVVIRADRFSNDDDIARIGSGCSIQDLAILHVHAENSIRSGVDTVINHGAIIHGTTSIGQNGFNHRHDTSVIPHACLGDRVFTRVMSVIEAVNIASDRYININSGSNSQDAAERLRPITKKEKEFMERAVLENREYAVRYKYSLEK